MGCMSRADLVPRAPFLVCCSNCADAQHRLLRTATAMALSSIPSHLATCATSLIRSGSSSLSAASRFAMLHAPTCPSLILTTSRATTHPRTKARSCMPTRPIPETLRMQPSTPSPSRETLSGTDAGADGDAEYSGLLLKDLYRAQAAWASRARCTRRKDC
ncbi:hypothetical protein C8Q76DRAFT_178501 [Earliella scabrosa]|nr:hypothetical protein C8Q76DRAFT_178501 [Earliella scabrosa]